MSKKSELITMSPENLQDILDLFISTKSIKLNPSQPELASFVATLKNHIRGLEDKVHRLERLVKFSNQTESIGKIGGWELNVETGDLIWTDETFHILEVEKSENSKPNLPQGLSLFTKESAPIVENAVKRAIEFGEPYSLEVEALTAKGQVKWVYTNGAANRIDGKIVSISGTIQDISALKQKELEIKFASESLGFGFWRFHIIDNILLWDKQMFKLYDSEESEFEGAYSAWEKKLNPIDKEIVVRELELAIAGEKEFNTEFSIVLKDGSLRYLAGKGLVLRDQNNKAYKMIGLNWDITERVQKEIDLKIFNMKLIHNSKLASLGEISAGIAHEINNPLAIINSAADSLLKSRVNQEKHLSKLDMIKKSCTRINKIVTGLKKYSRSDSVIEFKKCQLSTIIDEVLILTQAKIKDYDVSLSCQLTIESGITCNDVEIEQVLINLVNNAVDAIKLKDDRWIKIIGYENNTHVVLQFIDSGDGIPEHVRQRLYEPFFTTKNVGEGTGLGLSISKKILNDHNATIELINHTLGNCFEIKFNKLFNQ